MRLTSAKVFGREVCRAWSAPGVMLLSGLTASLTEYYGEQGTMKETCGACAVSVRNANKESI